MKRRNFLACILFVCLSACGTSPPVHFYALSEPAPSTVAKTGDSVVIIGPLDVAQYLKRPNIIVSDIGMPEVDGYQLLQQLRLLPGLGEVPAIAISGYASEEDCQRARSVGYLALVPKPVDIDALFSLVQDLKATAV